MGLLCGAIFAILYFRFGVYLGSYLGSVTGAKSAFDPY
jgi:hypothetical protein